MIHVAEVQSLNYVAISQVQRTLRFNESQLYKDGEETSLSSRSPEREAAFLVVDAHARANPKWEARPEPAISAKRVSTPSSVHITILPTYCELCELR